MATGEGWVGGAGWRERTVIRIQYLLLGHDRGGHPPFGARVCGPQGMKLSVPNPPAWYP